MVAARDRRLPPRRCAGCERGERFDIALLDLLMPELDGLELAAAIGGRPTARRRIAGRHPVVDRAARPRGRRGGRAWLAKPVKPSALHDTLATVLLGAA